MKVSENLPTLLGVMWRVEAMPCNSGTRNKNLGQWTEPFNFYEALYIETWGRVANA